MRKKIIKNMFSAICCISMFITGTRILNAEYSHKVLIISSDKSRFSDPVISRVINLLKKEGYSLKLSSQDELSNKTAKKFDAVLIINNIYKGQKNRSIRVFLDESGQKKIVLFNAVGSTYWKSADKPTQDKSDEIANSLIEKIKAVIGVVR